jgi:hypothetical protein
MLKKIKVFFLGSCLIVSLAGFCFLTVQDAYGVDPDALINAVWQLVQKTDGGINITKGKCAGGDLSIGIGPDQTPELTCPKGGKAKLSKLPPAVLTKITECP